jgi:hypothetical protein
MLTSLFYGFNVLSVPEPSTPQEGLIKISDFEGGTLYQTSGSGGSGKFYVVDLHGTFREMGRQYGYLLKDLMNEFYATSVISLEPTLASQNKTMSAVDSQGQQWYDRQPQFFKELIDGMTETSGLSSTQQKNLATMPGFLALGVPGCSSLGVWQDYTQDGSVVVGRNWDISGLDGFGKYLCCVVYNPVGYPSSVAQLDYVGNLVVQQAMNNHGLYFDLQDGRMSDPLRFSNRTVPGSTLFQFLLNSTNIDQVDALFRSTSSASGLVINVADAHEDRIYEWATYGVTVRNSTDGIIAATNHFLSPEWTNLPSVPDGLSGFFSKDRYAHLLYWGEYCKGQFNATLMMEVFDISILDGGATFPSGYSDTTFYQIVTTPGQLCWWFKAQGYSGWEEIDLKPLFQTSVE